MKTNMPLTKPIRQVHQRDRADTRHRDHPAAKTRGAPGRDAPRCLYLQRRQEHHPFSRKLHRPVKGFCHCKTVHPPAHQRCGSKKIRLPYPLVYAGFGLQRHAPGLSRCAQGRGKEGKKTPGQKTHRDALHPVPTVPRGPQRTPLEPDRQRPDLPPHGAAPEDPALYPFKRRQAGHGRDGGYDGYRPPEVFRPGQIHVLR